MQELFADKTHFFKFLSMSDKQCLDQLKIITELLLISWYKLLLEVQGRGKYPVLRTNTKPHQLINHTKISYFTAVLVFCKFLCLTFRNGLNRDTLKLRYSKHLEKYEPC